ncbi:MAG: HIT family protein, partial [Enterococcus cecorum]|nr:HIT family protein [Enterococcus cecorum]
IPRFSPHDDFSMHFGNHQDQYNPTLMEAIAKRIRESFE